MTHTTIMILVKGQSRILGGNFLIEEVMNTKLSIICVLAALLFSGCAKEPVSPDTPVVPDTPTAGRHLRLSGSAGNDNAATRASWADNNDRKLTFAWDYIYKYCMQSSAENEMLHRCPCLYT